MPALKQYSIVAQVPGARPYTLRPYTGTNLSEVLAITQALSMPPGSYGWMQSSGEVCVRTGAGPQVAYADFRPNDAKLELKKRAVASSGKRDAKLPPGVLDEEALARSKYQRLSRLPPLLIEIGPYCGLLREARDVYVDGHFYACVAMCGISFERFQRDKAKTCGATGNDKLWKVRKLLRTKKTLKQATLSLCEKMAGLRNEYAHGHGHNPKKDAVRAIGWLHRLIQNETDLMRDYEILEGVLHRKPRNA